MISNSYSKYDKHTEGRSGVPRYNLCQYAVQALLYNNNNNKSLFHEIKLIYFRNELV